MSGGSFDYLCHRQGSVSEYEHDRLFREGCSIAYIHAHMAQWTRANPKPGAGT